MMSEYNVPSEKLYQANDSRYEKMKYNRTGKSGLLLPAISLGLWHNFGFTDNFENSRNILKCAFDTGIISEEMAVKVNTHPANYEKQLLVDPNFYIGQLGELTEEFDTLIQQ